jgi:hypothetical protein
MRTILVAVSSIFLFIAAAGGQTAADLAKKYHHYEVYELKPGVQMTPKFDSSGMVCEIQVEQAHFVTNGIAFSSRIDERNAFSIIDDLVPTSERGAKLNTLEECMGICQTTYRYSNVAISIVSDGDTRLIRIKWRNRSCS